MRRAKELSQISAGLFVIAFVAFIFFAHEADGVMDKSGAGDYEQFEHFSRIAGASFWIQIFFWVLSVIFMQLSPQPYRGKSLFAVGFLAPVIFILIFMTGIL